MFVGLFCGELFKAVMTRVPIFHLGMERRTTRADTPPEYGVAPFSTGTMFAASCCRGTCFPLRLRRLKIKADHLHQPIDTSAKQDAYVYRQLLLPDKSKPSITDSLDVRKRIFKITVMDHVVTPQPNQSGAESSVSAVCTVDKSPVTRTENCA